MQVTRRYWASLGLAGLLAVAAIVLARPLLVVGATALSAWLLIQQWLFVRTANQLQSNLRVLQTVARNRVAVDESVTASLTAERPTTTLLPVHLDVEAGTPLGTTSSGEQTQQLTLTDGNSEATTTFTVQWPVARHVEFNPPTVRLTDCRRLFQTTFASRSSVPPTLTVTPQQPQSLHIGAGGDRMKGIVGDHPTGGQGPGIEPATIRQYTPSDSLNQIDWKATARSDEIYVRTYTEQTEYETALFIDHRAVMETGTPGETKLEYAREVALAVVDHAQEIGDLVGLAAVGDEGITEQRPAGATFETYSTLRTVLHDLRPTQQSESSATRSATQNATDSDVSQQAGITVSSPKAARQKATALTKEESEFASALTPFYTTAQTYVQRITEKPLYSTVQTYLTAGSTTSHPDRTVILTDDTHNAEVREAVKIARHHSEHVLVYLTPTVLFEPAGLTDMDEAYTRYTEFETFRRHLADLDRVSAFEVAPGDRLATLQAGAPSNISAR